MTIIEELKYQTKEFKIATKALNKSNPTIYEQKLIEKIGKQQFGDDWDEISKLRAEMALIK